MLRRERRVRRGVDQEQPDHEHEPNYARPLHHGERYRSAPDLLHDGPEDVAAVEREEREQVDDRERQRDQRDDADGLPRVVPDRLARDLVGPDRAADLLALPRIEDPERQGRRLLREVPVPAGRGVRRLARGQGLVRARLAVDEPQSHPLRLRVVNGANAEVDQTTVAADHEPRRRGGGAAVDERPLRAPVRGDPSRELPGAAAVAVDGDDHVAGVQDPRGREALAGLVDAHLARADLPEEDEQENRGIIRLNLVSLFFTICAIVGAGLASRSWWCFRYCWPPSG